MIQLRALGRLLRLSLLPSALADVAAGLVVGADGQWPAEREFLWLLPASLCIFHGGLALNDWVDRGEDACVRPDRPIPSGAIAPGAALALAVALLVTGGLLGYLADPRLGIATSVLALLAAGYDLRGRGPVLGPLFLGLCRATNLGIALYAAGRLSSSVPIGRPFLLAPALLYGLYVFSLSRLARLEDGAKEEIPPALAKSALDVCGLILVLAPLTAAGSTLARFGGLLLGCAGAWGLGRESHAPGTWTRARAGAATGAALRRLLVFTAALTLASWRESSAPLLLAPAILCGYPVSWALRRVFPPS